ncbi:MAG: hypothetical protein M1812_005918 [Candelaria pacifica]|nr:MAG: hypothetical protein M1812_005918 [Candelaria pacifica]
MQQGNGLRSFSNDSGAVIGEPKDMGSLYFNDNEALRSYSDDTSNAINAQHTLANIGSAEHQDLEPYNRHLMNMYSSSLTSMHPAHEEAQSRESFKARLLSLKSWPHDTPKAGYMASVGFFHSGSSIRDRYDDRVECFCCGLVLSHWVAEDDPLLRHLQRDGGCSWARRVAEFYEDNDHLREPDLLDVSVQPSEGSFASVPPQLMLPRPNHRCRGCNKTFATFLGLRTHGELRGKACWQPDSTPSSHALRLPPLDYGGANQPPFRPSGAGIQ